MFCLPVKVQVAQLFYEEKSVHIYVFVNWTEIDSL